MKDLLYFFLALALTITILSCTPDSETEGVDVNDPLTEVVADGSIQKTTGNPNRANYDVVIMDVDRWEICLNLNRSRYHCDSYTGVLWYQAGSFIFEGRATAVYNHQLDMFAVTALDSGWDRGHILYSMQFIEGTNNLYGSFVYYEYPRRTNGIDAWLIHGQMGPHKYEGSSILAKEGETEYYVPNVHPKKARLEADD